MAKKVTQNYMILAAWGAQTAITVLNRVVYTSLEINKPTFGCPKFYKKKQHVRRKVILV